MGVFSRMSALAAVATAAFALAAPSAANAWEWPTFGLFGDDGAPTMDAPANDDTPVTFASGWYLRGDLAVAQDAQVNLSNIVLPGRSTFPNSWAVGIGAGYKFSNWLRADVTLEERAPRSFAGNTSAMKCPMIVTNGVVPANGTQTCYDWYHARLNNVTMMFNLYADLGTWYGLTPYVGVGIGTNYVYQQATRNWYLSQNATAAIYTLTDTVNGATYSFNFDDTRATSEWTLAWAVMGGASYALTPHMAVDLGLRYLNMGSIKSMYATSTTTSTKNTATEFRVGFRYTPD